MQDMISKNISDEEALQSFLLDMDILLVSNEEKTLTPDGEMPSDIGHFNTIFAYFELGGWNVTEAHRDVMQKIIALHKPNDKRVQV